MPVGQVQDLSLCPPQHRELVVSSLLGELARLQVFAAQDRVHLAQASPSEPQPHGYAQHLIRVRLDEVVERRGATVSARYPRVQAEALKSMSSLVPEH